MARRFRSKAHVIPGTICAACSFKAGALDDASVSIDGSLVDASLIDASPVDATADASTCGWPFVPTGFNPTAGRVRLRSVSAAANVSGTAVVSPVPVLL